MNPTSGERRASPDAERKNPTAHRPGSKSSVRKLLQLIYKGSVYWWNENSPIERLLWLSLKPYVQTELPFVRVNKGHVQQRFELWLLCSKKQLQNSYTNKTYLSVKAPWIYRLVRTLNRITQLLELTASAVEHNIDIVCIQEHRYHHSEVEIKYHDSGNGRTFISASARKNSVSIAS